MYSRIPEKFAERYGPLADDKDAFLSSLLRPLPKAFRVNTLKASPEEVKKRFSGYGIGVRQMAWYPDAFVSDNPSLGKTLEHFLGHIYMQDLESMLPPLAVRKELEGAGMVLDACAAPGSKTTQLAALMANRGTIIANDLNYGRIRALRFNLEKAGGLNAVVTNLDLRKFLRMEFGVILLDAPCSAEGTARKSAVLETWYQKVNIKHSNLQKQLILKAFDLLAEGGVLLYSTCTFSPEENEEVVDYLLQKAGNAKVERIEVPGFRLSPGVGEWQGRKFNPEVLKTSRVWPHHNDTGGFFLAKVRK